MLAFLFALIQAASPVTEHRVVIPNDGWRLIGDFRPATAARAPAVLLLLNGAMRTRKAYAGLARELGRLGIASLRLDLRGEGETINRGRFQPGPSPTIDQSDRDVDAALTWLRSRPGIDSGRIGVLGASYSGEAMAVAARQGAAGAAYVALSPGSLSEESMREIDSSGRPWWLIASDSERFARRVVDQAAAISGSAKVTYVSGRAHASDILGVHLNLEAEIADWFAAKLRGIRAPELWGPLSPGGYHVGFRRRRLGGLIVDLWYPARSSPEPMRFADYLELADDLRGRVSGSLEKTLAATITGDSLGLDPATTARILAAPMAATRNAVLGAGAHPLLLWTPRYGTTVAQSVLSEFLASRGFVVAFPRPVEGGKLPFELATGGEKAAELERRVGDLRAALRALGGERFVRPGLIGVLAWSYTGEMATAFQLEEPRVSLVVGLSTNLLSEWVYRPGEEGARSIGIRPNVAYALVTQPKGPPSGSPPALERVPGPRYYVELPGLKHGSFNALEGFLPSLLGVVRVQRWSASGPAGVAGYEAIATMVLRLARHHVAARSPATIGDTVLTSGLGSLPARVE
jgi:dienelactone hydrolase